MCRFSIVAVMSGLMLAIPEVKAGEIPGSNAWNVAVVADAKTWVGTPYVLGGSTNKGIDCSWLVYRVYNKVSNPGASYNYRTVGNILLRVYTPIQPRVGDLVLFQRKDNCQWEGHVGIWVGGRNFIHACGDPKINKVVLDNFDYSSYDQAYGGRGYLTRKYNIHIVRYSPDSGKYYR